MILLGNKVNNDYGTEQIPSDEVSWKDISNIIRAKEIWERIIETRQVRYENLSIFEPEYELLVDFLEDWYESGV
jgi:hypothetical protein